MTRTGNARRSLLAAVIAAALLACDGPPGPSARFRPATASDPVLAKGGTPLRALPSHVVSGEVAAFRPPGTDPGIPKRPDAAAPLPSELSTGHSAAYAPRGRARTAGADAPAVGGAASRLELLPE